MMTRADQTVKCEMLALCRVQYRQFKHFHNIYCEKNIYITLILEFIVVQNSRCCHRKNKPNLEAMGMRKCEKG